MFERDWRPFSADPCHSRHSDHDDRYEGRPAAMARTPAAPLRDARLSRLQHLRGQFPKFYASSINSMQVRRVGGIP